MTQAVFFNDTDDIAQVLSNFKHLLCLFLLLHNENLPLKWQIVYCKKQKEKNTKQEQQPKPVVFEWLVTTVQPTDRERYEKRSLTGKVISLPPYPWSFVSDSWKKPYRVFNIFISHKHELKTYQHCFINLRCRHICEDAHELTGLALLFLPGALSWPEKVIHARRGSGKAPSKTGKAHREASGVFLHENFVASHVFKDPNQPESSTGLNSGPWRSQVQHPGRAGIMGPDPAPHQESPQPQSCMDTLQLLARKLWFDSVSPSTTKQLLIFAEGCKCFFSKHENPVNTPFQFD